MTGELISEEGVTAALVLALSVAPYGGGGGGSITTGRLGSGVLSNSIPGWRTMDARTGGSVPTSHQQAA